MIESAPMNWRSKWAFWEPAPLKTTATSYTPHDGGSTPSLISVEFRHKAPKAKTVELVGDFNAWKPGLLKMSRGADGVWTISLPVLAGRHKYLFLVDGEPKVDERADTADGPQGRRVAVRSFK
jgi:1,4-alpha-glucan branching enzyme